MQFSPDSSRATLLLTNRLVHLDAKPLTAREFWSLVERVDLGDLLHADTAEISRLLEVDVDEANRHRQLLDAATALSFEQERLHDGGVTLISALDDSFPTALRARLGAACPPFLLVAGPVDWLSRDGLGIVGSRDASDDVLDVARQAAKFAAGEGWTVVSGLARGVDQVAMAAALDVGGQVVGIPADGILNASRNAEVRRRVHNGEICIASPYAPDAPFRAGNAMGRNKLIYALSHLTFVVVSDEGSGGTWTGAVEALDRRFAPVAVWSGTGSKPGNDALIKRGAHVISEVSQLSAIDTTVAPPPLQTSLF